MVRSKNLFLVIGASLSAVAALLHLACIVFGAPMYLFMGAGKQIAAMADAGHWLPVLLQVFYCFGRSMHFLVRALFAGCHCCASPCVLLPQSIWCAVFHLFCLCLIFLITAQPYGFGLHLFVLYLALSI